MNKEKKFIIAGLLFILFGFLMNEWFLAALFSSDGVIAGSHRLIIWVTDFLLIGTGFIVIKYRESLSKETIFVITGLLFIFACILFIEKFFPVMIDAPISNQNRLFLRIIEVYLIATGVLAILYRKSIDLKNFMLFGMSSLISFTLFLGYDYYRSYSIILRLQSHNAKVTEKIQKQLFIKDNKLGWKLIPNSVVRHTEQGIFDVTYEIDENGFRKINNTAGKPDFNIYFIGDSFTFGHGVDNHETFSAVIKEKYLKENVNVYNAGVMGYGIVQMFQRFLILKELIQPNDLVIFIPISEDIKRNLTEFSFPYFIKFTNILKVDFFPFFDNGEITYRKMENSISNKLKLIAITAEYTGTYFKSIRNKFVPDTTKKSIEMIEIIERDTKLKGGKFALFFLPKTEECFNKNYTVDISAFDYFDIMHYFPSKQNGLNELIFSNKDSHWKAPGHEIAAKAIIETLLNAGIIDDQYLRQNL
jgi:hypothetical protein